MEIRLSLTGLRKELQRFAGIRMRLATPEVVLTRVARMVLSEAKKNVKEGGRSKVWAPRRKEPPDAHKLLWKSGDLYRSLSSIDFPTTTSVRFGTDKVYAKWQQFGTYEGKGISPRPFLYFTEDITTKIRQMIGTFLATGMGSDLADVDNT